MSPDQARINRVWTGNNSFSWPFPYYEHFCTYLNIQKKCYYLSISLINLCKSWKVHIDVVAEKCYTETEVAIIS